MRPRMWQTKWSLMCFSASWEVLEAVIGQVEEAFTVTLVYASCMRREATIALDSLELINCEPGSLVCRTSLSARLPMRASCRLKEGGKKTPCSECFFFWHCNIYLIQLLKWDRKGHPTHSKTLKKNKQKDFFLYCKDNEDLNQCQKTKRKDWIFFFFCKVVFNLIVIIFFLFQTNMTSRQNQRVGILFTAKAPKNVLTRTKFVTSTLTVHLARTRAWSAVSALLLFLHPRKR